MNSVNLFENQTQVYDNSLPLYQEALNGYDSIRKSILNNQLERLSEEERELIFSFLIKIQTISQAIQNRDLDFLQVLFDNGLNFGNTSESFFDKFSLHEEIDFKVVDLFIENQYVFTKWDISKLLETRNYQSKDCDLFEKILTHLIPRAACQDLSYSSKRLFKYAKKHGEFDKILLNRYSELIKKYPHDPFLNSIIEENFFYFLEKKVIEYPITEELVKDKTIFRHLLILETSTLEPLEEELNKSQEFQRISAESSDFKANLIYFVLISTKTLDEFASMIEVFSGKRGFPFQLPEQFKKSCSDHLKSLQNQRNFWELFPSRHYFWDNVDLLIELDCDPNWTNSKNQNILFTSLLSLYGTGIFGELNFSLIDANGHNALEHHCSKKPTKALIDFFFKAGLRLQEGFPFLEKAKEIFPDSEYLQIILATSFSLSDATDSWGSDLSDFLMYFDNEVIKKIRSVIPEKTKVVKQPRHPHINVNPVPVSKERLIEFIELVKGQRKTLSIEDFKTIIKKYSELASLWEGKPDAALFRLIPESATASLLIHTIIRQKNRDKNTPPLPIQGLLDILNHDDFVLFNEYLFKNPEIMKIFFQDYMKLHEVNISRRGSTKSDFGLVAREFLKKMSDFRHLPDLSKMDPAHIELINSFQKKIPPLPLRNLEIDGKSKSSLLGRTILVHGEKEYNAYKFIKPKEDYLSFSQEESVTNAFNNLKNEFESEFHKPMGVYVIKELPQEFKMYQEELPPSPYYIYHYKADKKTFKYLQNVSARKYEMGRVRSLTDAVRMNKLGIFPDLAALFHNEGAGRVYILLIDLIIHFFPINIMPAFAAEGGAGRLDQVFAKIKFPNMRSTGLTDLRDAKVSHFGNLKTLSEEFAKLPDTNEVKHLFHLFGLSNILLVDMLILLCRYKLQKKLDWRNKKSLKEFGNELLQGFALTASIYSGRPREDCQHSAKNCGINWIRMARQIAFWTDNSENGYPPYVDKEILPENLYEEGVKVVIKKDNSGNFNLFGGFMTAGNQDIGMFNGPLALTEFEKLAYSFIFPMALAEPLHASQA